MALFGRDDKDPSQDHLTETKDTPSPRPMVSTPAPASSASSSSPTNKVIDGVEVSAYLGKGSRIGGKLHFDGTVRVDGQVEGEISAEDTMIIGETAVVTAQISGNTVIIRGKVTGDIKARKRVEIQSPGKHYGNITTPSLVIHEGVVFEGHCSMGSEVSKAEPKLAPFQKEEKGRDRVLAKMKNEASK